MIAPRWSHDRRWVKAPSVVCWPVWMSPKSWQWPWRWWKVGMGSTRAEVEKRWSEPICERTHWFFNVLYDVSLNHQCMTGANIIRYWKSCCLRQPGDALCKKIVSWPLAQASHATRSTHMPKQSCFERSCDAPGRKVTMAIQLMARVQATPAGRAIVWNCWGNLPMHLLIAVWSLPLGWLWSELWKSWMLLGIVLILNHMLWYDG